MASWDEKKGLWIWVARDAIGYGTTPDEARRYAEQAVRVLRLRAQRVKKMKQIRRYKFLDAGSAAPVRI